MGASGPFRYTESSTIRQFEAMSLDPNYPRDLIGYGRHPVQANWPGRARVAVQFVLN
jgi:allantoinase